ncbi:LysR family transcriptional regulator [Actinopolymorpha alba]|uniref:LysR family transcriptional regulator n=1 Tax=Actinopolymorpha alba TaxID=533267 RepID=UPI00037D61B9|nr:LysR family transcriptional regulator [Actinopolymorpha alba]
MLDVNRLRVLHEVARAGSFSAAARALHITPSAVSQQVAALERSVGLPVVIRSPRGVRLTEPGRLLAEATASMVAGLTQVERQVAAYVDGVVGRLAVATFPSAGQSLLPWALAPLTGRADVELTFREAETEDALSLVRDGAADLALVYHFFTPAAPEEWLRDLDYTPLLEEEMFAALPERHELAGADEIPLTALAGEAWLKGTGDCGRQVEQFFLSAGIQARTACRSGDYTFVQTLVAGGVGVALIPSLALAPHIDGIRFVRVSPALRRYVGVVRRKERWQPPLVRELLGLLREAAGSLDLPGLSQL